MVLKHSRMTKEGNTILAMWLVAGGAMSAAERVYSRLTRAGSLASARSRIRCNTQMKGRIIK